VSKRRHANLAQKIQAAMKQAVRDAHSEGVFDPEVIRERIKAARSEAEG
jgi:hypothetical protein